MERAGDRGDNPRVGIHKAFDATEGSTEHSKFFVGGEAKVWTVAANKAGKRVYRGVLEAAERFITKWHEIEATLSRNRQASTTGGFQGNRKGEAGRRWQTG